ncbi:MAG: transcription-repair coupling factor [Phycisphaeraceae bacterium]|nr:transcription-repair coupling factor [Phycisphaeraceae bacterium]
MTSKPPPTAHAWLRDLVDSTTVELLAEQVAARGRVVASGSWGSSAILLAGALAVRTRRTVMLVVAHLDDTDDAIEDLQWFTRIGMPVTPRPFSALETLPGESNVQLELLAARLAVVDAVVSNQIRDVAEPAVLVAPIQALMQAVPEPDALCDFSKHLRSGDTCPPAKLIDWLDHAGYTRNEVIEQPGDFATRGGIIDVYLPSGLTDEVDAAGGPLPIRLDYFGDEVESIRRINTDSMGSEDKIAHVQMIGTSAAGLQSDERTTNLLELLHEDTLFVLNEVMELAEQGRGYYERLTNPRGIYPPNAVLQKLTKRDHVEINQYSTGDDADIELPVHSLMLFDTNPALAIDALIELADDAARVTVLCQKKDERDRLIELIREHDEDAVDLLDIEVGYLHRGFLWAEDGGQMPIDTTPSPVNATESSPSADEFEAKEANTSDDDGLESNDAPDSEDAPSDQAESQIGNHKSKTSPVSQIVVTHHELFHRYHTRRRIRRVSFDAESVADVFFDLDVGDYVVHIDHGIARFTGLRTMRTKERSEDFLTLEFANNALLHVPATDIDLVQKYIGGFHGTPPLSLLGGKRWTKTKRQVEDAVKDLAAGMLRIQAARAAMPGVGFPTDTKWQREFEAEFPYTETEDQIAAIAETKRGMIDERPMDRLICGDVGFGKTEVAIRAAFKAAEFGKQVAVLVPTTVLAEQHERTFKERMAGYPFRIESISRFKSIGRQKELLDELGEGKIDIVIGTHRLLSKDVKFSDVGLIVIDEEQRFGVEHKQRLLQFRMTADVLTLTATPIPRTLHMSLMGLRDISSLTTAPLDRRAIVTEVISYDEKRIRNAIRRELSREGQVFFVHNRVHNIKDVADELQRIAPEARIAIGHGQMTPHQLEQVMLDFIRAEIDVLVCTTIIESGIDIPSANTMLINNADHFGLADLHQLRGRIGRYKHRAYCYLLLPKDRPITEMSRRRLNAIEQYSMLGAGFKIAMRDLEIRGAGNLLGAEQSGHIAAVGYEMYCNMLEDATNRMRESGYVDPVRTHLDLPIKGHVPHTYVSSQTRRMEAYKRFARCDTQEQLNQLVDDLTQAYGKPPASTQMLISLAEIRIALSQLEVTSFRLEKKDLIFRMSAAQKLEPYLSDAPGRLSVVDAKTLYYRPPDESYLEPQALLAILRLMLLRKPPTVVST